MLEKRLPFVKEAIPFIAIGCIFVLISLYIKSLIFFSLSVFFTSFTAFFFRDPKRDYRPKKNEILSPADGRIIEIEEKGDKKKISIFMSIFDVHVNRIPADGTVKRIIYEPGCFLRADKKEASYLNEKNKVIIELKEFPYSITLIQIAGKIARRIICWIKEGDKVRAGQKFGLICFGSRVELYLDKRCKVDVRLGQKVKAGITVIGYLG